MNAISFLSNVIPTHEDSIKEEDEEDVLMEEKVKEELRQYETQEKGVSSVKKIVLMWIWYVFMFFPNYLVIKPIFWVWYVITFPLNLMETNKLKQISNIHEMDSLQDEKDSVRSDKYTVEEDLSPTDGLVINQDKMKPRSLVDTLGKFHFPKKLVPQSILFSTGRKLLILDLDETLIHSMISRTSQISSPRGKSTIGEPTASVGPSNSTPTHLIEVRFPKSNITTLYNVAKRPYCDMFLQQVNQWYDLAIFTASMKEYADPVIDWLQQTGSSNFKYRWYRDHCTLRHGVGYVKDIASLVNKNESRDLSQMIIIDNSPISYAMHLDNAIQVHGWINDPSDSELLHLLPLLHALRNVTDTRCILSLKSGRSAIPP